jgi:hypothetical protein
MPAHDGGVYTPVPASTVATWPEGSFVENIAIDGAGAAFVTIHPPGEIRRIGADGMESLFTTLPTSIAGLAFDRNGTLFVSGGTPGVAGGVIWRVAPSGAFDRWVDLPEAPFLNGITPLPGGGMLVVDSILGRVWRIETDRPERSLWLDDARLTPQPGVTGLPGVNGIKRFGRSITVSNTTRATILRCDLDAAGAAGPIAVIAENLRADDIAFDVDGALYCTTHIQYSLVRLARDGTRATLAGPSEGMVGSTAAAFGRRADDRTALYVTTTGGVGAPYEGRLQPAKLVRLEIGVEGVPLL